MAELKHTQGEILFEQYLASQNLPFEFEKEHPGKNKKPDYTIEWDGSRIVFDVKDFKSPPMPTASVSAFNSYPAIRERIVRGRKKFKEYKELCCALVLVNSGAFVMLEHADFMLGSMYGDSGFVFPFNTRGVGVADKMQRAFLTGGMMLSPEGMPRNTTVSALITLTRIAPDFELVRALKREYPQIPGWDIDAVLQESKADYDPHMFLPRVIVWHNSFARIPFPSALFCGPYDAHVKLVHLHTDTFEKQVIFRGSQLPATVDL